MRYIPTFSLTDPIVALVASISEQLDALSITPNDNKALLRSINHARSVQGLLAIDGKVLTEAQLLTIAEGKRVKAPKVLVQEAKRLLSVYQQLDDLQLGSLSSLLATHKSLMVDLDTEGGEYRKGGVGIIKNNKTIHQAPPANTIPTLMKDLFIWIKESDAHPLIKSCVLHYEIEFIHPFNERNETLAFLWQTLILKQQHDLFSYLPIESVIAKQIKQYKRAITVSKKHSDSAPFIEFMLSVINELLGSLTEYTDLDVVITPEITPQIKTLIKAIQAATEEKGVETFKRETLQQLLKLKDKKSFTQRYLKPALEEKVIEMTIPDKPTSRLQQYRLTKVGKLQ